jgi:hypothetical protein
MFYVSFADGPAEGVSLELQRAPRFMRVVVGSGMDGQWDALDQIDDSPEPDELIHVYVKQPGEGMLHLDMVNKKTRRREGRSYITVSYELSADQPDDATARNKERWQAWCREKAA